MRLAIIGARLFVIFSLFLWEILCCIDWHCGQKSQIAVQSLKTKEEDLETSVWMQESESQNNDTDTQWVMTKAWLS